MKKILSLVVLMAVMATATFASGGAKVNPAIEESFSKTFAGAQYVTWKIMKDENIHHAAFTYQNQRLNAYFDADAKLIATGRHIHTSNLPLLVTRNLDEKFPTGKITDVIEYVQNEETSYLVTIETSKATVVVKANPIGSSYIFKKEKK